MPTSLAEAILEELRARPGQKAADLAKRLQRDKGEINSLLYGTLKPKVRQDTAYKWWLVEAGQPRPSPQGAQPQPAADPPHAALGRLCRYYLACLGYDETGVSTFQTSRYGDPDYFECDSLPVDATSDLDQARARRLLTRRPADQGRVRLYFGYPTLLRRHRAQSGWQGFMVEPILLFPIEDIDGRLTIDVSYPIINQTPLRHLTRADAETLSTELVQLERDLGLGDSEDSPDIDEVALRLASIRADEWPWREDIDPGAIGEGAPLNELHEMGIYNRAVVIAGEASQFTQGLEQELRELSTVPRSKLTGTVLGNWLDGRAFPVTEPVVPDISLIEVLPMNTEQRSAVAAALTRPMTVITGPPGTGKSQVVTNLLANAAWSGKRVLFASKNNKAVDVVETRINALGPRPFLLRVGARVYQAKLAEYVLGLLSATVSQGDREEFEDAKKVQQRLDREAAMLVKKAEALVALRNQTDVLEQKAEDARQRLGKRLFSAARNYHTEGARSKLDDLIVKARHADRQRANWLTRLLWPLHRKSRLNGLAEVVSAQGNLFIGLEVKAPQSISSDADVVDLSGQLEVMARKLDDIDVARLYFASLLALQSADSLETLGRAEDFLRRRQAKNSEQLWKLWLRLQPSMIDAEARQKLGRYTAILRMMMEAGDNGQAQADLRNQYLQVLKDIRQILPCWAVTSLSARNRVPFEPGVFDIVVFDEASQCDIASALPLLYRAKNVVVIGDPKQLAHISALPRGQDQKLLDKFDLLDDFPHWGYSHQSLFGLAATQVQSGEMVSLVDHHRSHADIINFSNAEFYEERLRVATRYDHLKRPNTAEPGVRWQNAPGRATRPGSSGALNEQEAAALVDAISDLVLTKRYTGSIGVVTPFRAHANRIRELVNRDAVLAAELSQRAFLVETAHRFQGDERDVIFFSPVLSDGMPPGALNFLRQNGNLFNVAITRARAQLIVVGDLTVCANSEVGYLSRFAKYAVSLRSTGNKEAGERMADLGPSYPTVARPDLVSDWERYFYEKAFRAGLRLVPQYAVEKYILDFLLLDGERRLAIEIDGERYHRSWTGELCRRDQIRNQRLFELGYDVMRFWVYEVRDDLDGCLQKISKWRALQ